jgi:hypothetical protein
VSQSADGNRIPDRLEASVKLILPFGVAFFGLVFSGPAAAQALQIPRVEVGGEFGILEAIGPGLYLTPTAGPRLTFNISQQDSIELTADTQVFDRSSLLYGLYFLQYKRTTKRPSAWSGIRPFYTAGTGGYYIYRRVPERRDTRPDGAVVIYPAHATGALSRFNIATFGGGLERALNHHASFRFEGSGHIAFSDYGCLCLRILAGVSVPMGGYRAATIE